MKSDKLTNLIIRIINRLRLIRKSQHCYYFLKAKVKKINDNKVFLSFKGKEGYYLPYPSKSKITYRVLFMVFKGFSQWLLEKYTTESIQLRKTDTVIDCGAFVGSFSIAAIKMGAQKVYSVEPSSKNFDCLKSNIAHYNYEDKIVPLNIGLDSEQRELPLNLSCSGCDDSFLKPDECDLETSEMVKTKTLSDLIDKYRISPDNLFLKVEAEGYEPEVIYGLKNYRPKVIVVDVTPERNNLSPEDEIENYLKVRGYKITLTRRCLFAVLH